MKKTMLKKEDWGGLTIVALLATYIFPPYFVYLLTVAALTEFAHLWTTRLSRPDQEKFINFEKEFRKGYKLEKAGDGKGALLWYRKLEKEYAGLPQASKLATLQIKKLETEEKKKNSSPSGLGPSGIPKSGPRASRTDKKK